MISRRKIAFASPIIFFLLFAFSSVCTASEPGKSPAAAQGEKININTASELELAYLPGIGPSTAARIVQYRKKQPFQKEQHLMRVKGIGRKTFAKIKPYIVVKGPTTAAKKIKASS